MGLTVKNNTAFGVELEVTEGTYVAPAGASSFVQVLKDGAEIKPSKEVLERNIFVSSIGKTSPRTGQFQAQVTMPVECRANSVAGSAPEFDKLMKSAMGTRRQNTTQITTKSSGNTASILQIDDADITKLKVGDMILVLQSGAYHVTPLTAVDSTGGAANVTVLVPHPSGDFTDSVVIEKFTTYLPADSGHPSLSISKYIESAVREYVVGARVNSLALENFTTGQIPSFKFGLEGLNFNSAVSAIPFTPSYDSALPPIILDARLYQNGTSIEVNQVSFTLENTLAFETSIAAANGRIAGRAVERTVSGSFNPYKLDNSVANYTKFVNNTAFSLFAYAKVPTGVTGQFNQVVAFYMPNCLITELSEADQDGLLQEAITFSANRGTSGTTNEIYIGFI